jgi:hypothetical protein
MTTIPEMCMAYTEVYKIVRLEHGLALGIGIVLGIFAYWFNDR